MASYEYTSYYPTPEPLAAPPMSAPLAPPSLFHAPPAQAYGPPGAYCHPYGPPPSMVEEIRTIFITGFPQDVKERELNNLLRFLPGYEASQMNWNNGLAQGFALFANAGYARAACSAVSQLVFDESSVLRCEIARKNMFIKQPAEQAVPEGKRPRSGSGGFSGAVSGGPAYSSAPAMPTFQAAGPVAGSGSIPGDNPPCNTLFLGNLHQAINESELNAVFAASPGFRQLKVVRGRNTTAFVEYDTTENAIRAHNMNQNAVLASNVEKGGIRVQYSRNPYGKKRDFTGNMIDTPVRGSGFPAGPAGFTQGPF